MNNQTCKTCDGLGWVLHNDPPTIDCPDCVTRTGWIKTCDGVYKRADDCSLEELEWSNYKRGEGNLVVPLLVVGLVVGLVAAAFLFMAVKG